MKFKLWGICIMGSGTGVCGTLGIIFIVLKLVGVIAWSWWWVLAPFWIPLVITIVVLIVMGIMALIFK